MVRWVVLLALAGCNYVTDSFETNDFSGDAYPIDVETSSGALVVGAEISGDSHVAVLDVMSPVTLVDRGETVPASIDYPDITILGERGPGGALDLPRARLVEPQVLSVHPCSDPTCGVGTPAAPRPYDALIGMDAFNSDALRLTLGAGQISILPNIAGSAADLSRACEAVLPAPFHGGGTILLGGTELAFTNWRIALDTCLAPKEDPMVPQAARGADVLLVLSTGVGISLLSESAYARYTQVNTTAPMLAALPDDSVLLPSGLVSGKRATIEPQAATLPTLALVAADKADPRSPCRQVFASHVLVPANCQVGTIDCPCAPGSRSCGVPAVIELSSPTGLDVLVVSDADPTLQALGAELSPDQPQVDGILGTAALHALQLDIDYPHNRALGRCSDKTACKVRPQLDIDSCGTQCSRRANVQACVGPE